MGLPVAAATLSLSAMSEAAPAKSPIHALIAQCGEVDRQLRKRAGVANEPDLSRGDRAHGLVVPHGGARARGRPAPPQDILDGDVGERLRCCCKVGVAAARPSVVSRARPSSSTSRGRGAARSGGRARTARQISDEDVSSAGPAKIAAPQAVR